MFNFEIDEELKNFKCYMGTYSKDTLPIEKIDMRPIAYITNTANKSDPGEHWVALFISVKNVAEYFDSFGFNPICCRIYKFLKLNKIDTLLINRNSLQNIFADTCGKYCTLFVKMRCDNMTFKKFLNLFSHNTEKNEIIIENFV